ncbi:cell division protein FtsQ/DivIB [Lutibacter sp. B1]|uniref:cell division protein FtsQ/DivIB n=1 Tax=Lutibacter sp. B1 TaxID=2725996 RepID=UPI001457114F|nr:cell division protein FtsQ [Lutibacter sp. B1]NLP57368.1 cell division protein FtsQ [Lutibacter sp. B1]
MLKINWNYIKGLFLAALVVFLYGFSHKKNSTQKVHDISIEFEKGDNLFMNYDMVNKLLIQNGKTVKNQAKSVIDLQKFEAKVLAHPMVEDASVYLTVDGLLKTKIKQRTPIARITTNSSSYYIDRQAKVMPLSSNHSARTLLVSGNIKEEDSKKIYQLASTILSDEFLKKQIIGVQKMQNNEFVLMTRIGGQIILIGKIEDLKQKFENLKSFFNKTLADNTIDNYTTINLKYNNQVVCTKK